MRRANDAQRNIVAGTASGNDPEKLNVLDIALFHELGAHVAAIAKQTERAGCVVVCRAGCAFSAGHDLGAIGAAARIVSFVKRKA
jgi:enoyl-CoA hydratase/carnithine racemase